MISQKTHGSNDLLISCESLSARSNKMSGLGIRRDISPGKLLASIAKSGMFGRVAAISLIPVTLFGALSPARAQASLKNETIRTTSETRTLVERSREGLTELRFPTVASEIPVCGEIDPEFCGIDQIIEKAMVDYQASCASVAVTWKQKLIVNRTYGWKDLEGSKAAPPNVYMRLASVDKLILITAAELFLSQGHKMPNTDVPITADLHIFQAMKDSWGLQPPPGMTPDSRVYDITIQNILDGKSGIKELSDSGEEVIRALGLSKAPGAWDLLRYTFGNQLHSNPGEKQVYANNALGVLKYFIDKCWSDKGGYLDFVKTYVFKPAGTDQVVISRASPADRDPRESCYISMNNGRSTVSSDQGKIVSAADGGGMNLDSWLALATSAEAMCRYLDYWYMGHARPLLDPSTGTLLSGIDNGAGTFGGTMPGTNAEITQRRHALCNFVVIFNRGQDNGVKPRSIIAEIDNFIHDKGVW